MGPLRSHNSIEKTPFLCFKSLRSSWKVPIQSTVCIDEFIRVNLCESAYEVMRRTSEVMRRTSEVLRRTRGVAFKRMYTESQGQYHCSKFIDKAFSHSTTTRHNKHMHSHDTALLIRSVRASAHASLPLVPGV